MKIMVIGKGGREHALVWKLSQSPDVKEIYAVPGNAGIEKIAKTFPVSPEDITNIIKIAEEIKPNLVVVGPENPLFLGIVDALSQRNFVVFGPTKSAAILEKEKAFAKKFMQKYRIPTAPFKIFDSIGEAKKYIKKKKYPIVVKASGPALGKGSVVCENEKEAFEAIDNIMVKRIFGSAGDKVVIEEFLEGEEASIMIITDGKDYVPLLPSQDYKRIYDHDKGPNTGGMGAYAPAPIVDVKVWGKVEKKILFPLFEGLKKEKIFFQGVIYIGLMIQNNGDPYVLEFNVRFGDPETQPVLFLLKSDLFWLLYESATGKISQKPEWEEKYAVCVVVAAKGYPGKYEKGKKITIGEIEEDVYVFHAGTKKKDSALITDGGRVLGVTAKDKDLKKAKDKTYRNLKKIQFDGMYYRKDIADKGIRRLYGKI